ncbi:hypothetical protein [Thermus thermophilus]|uniref:hypothetical protein n=1 Tax=Thermus thermophilus TaxID=274 RepID=UPI001FCB6817|nr:hypothetical protein [Thermus thermophilus]
MVSVYGNTSIPRIGQDEVDRWDAAEWARGVQQVRVYRGPIVALRRLARRRGVAAFVERQDGPRDAEVWFRVRLMRFDEERRDWRVEADSSWATSLEEAVGRLA